MISSKSTTVATQCCLFKETHPLLPRAPSSAISPSKSCAKVVSSGLLLNYYRGAPSVATPNLFCSFPPVGSDVPFTLVSSTSLVLVLFRTDGSVVSTGFAATLAPKSSGEYGPFPNPPESRTSENTITVGSDGKPVNPPYPFDVSGD